MRITSSFIKRTYTSILLGTFVVLSWCMPPLFLSAILGLILFEIILFEWSKFFSPTQTLYWLIMPVYPVAPFILLILLNQNPFYQPLVYILFILVSTFDTGSYIAGKAYGTHPIAPHISPGKTWQGLIGGYVITTVVLYALCSILHAPPTSWLNVIFISLLLCLFSFAGDLFESFLKRRAGIKDSGNILPGHGGFLDRFDSLLCAVIFFYAARNYLLTFFNV